MRSADWAPSCVLFLSVFARTTAVRQHLTSPTTVFSDGCGYCLCSSAPKHLLVCFSSAVHNARRYSDDGSSPISAARLLLFCARSHFPLLAGVLVVWWRGGRSGGGHLLTPPQPPLRTRNTCLVYRLRCVSH